MAWSIVVPISLLLWVVAFIGFVVAKLPSIAGLILALILGGFVFVAG